MHLLLMLNSVLQMFVSYLVKSYPYSKNETSKTIYQENKTRAQLMCVIYIMMWPYWTRRFSLSSLFDWRWHVQKTKSNILCDAKSTNYLNPRNKPVSEDIIWKKKSVRSWRKRGFYRLDSLKHMCSKNGYYFKFIYKLLKSLRYCNEYIILMS